MMPRTKRQAEQRKQQQYRIRDCERLIANACYDGEIKRIVARRYGINPRTVERDIAQARRNILERRNRGRNELQAESMAYYERVLRDKRASQRDKLYARKRIDELLALEEPRRHELSGPGGGAIPVDIDHAKSRLAEIADRVGGTGGD